MSIADIPEQGTAANPNPGMSISLALPSDQELEGTILGCMMVAHDCIDAVCEIVTAEDFYSPAHETIFRAICHLWHGQERVAPSFIAVGLELRKRGEIHVVGGESFVFSVSAKASTGTEAAWLAGKLHEVTERRKVTQILISGMQQIQDWSIEPGHVMERTVTVMSEMANGRPSEKEKLWAHELQEQFVDELHAGRDPRAVDTPWRDLNEVIELLPGQLVTVGAATSGGKSLFGLNLAEHAAYKRGLPTLVASMEMAQMELMARLNAHKGNIDLDNLVRRKPTETDWTRIAGVDMSGGWLALDDSAGMTVSRIRSRARWMASQGHAPGLIVADYLQLLTPETGGSNKNRAQEVADISRGLKLLANELKCPVVALAQFNRGAVGRKPQVTDFKDSSSIEQDSNVIVLLHRELAEDGTDTGPTAGEVLAIVAKNRNGASGCERKLAFQGHRARLGNLAKGF